MNAQYQRPFSSRGRVPKSSAYGAASVPLIIGGTAAYARLQAGLYEDAFLILGVGFFGTLFLLGGMIAADFFVR